MIILHKIFKVLLLSVLLGGYLPSYAQEYTHPNITQLISANEEPFGVVFELVEGDQDAWQWAAPMVKDFSKQLKKKYPQISIAIVSHGYEQFQLTKKNIKQQNKTFSILKGLVDKGGADLHVCGTHSSWYNVPDEDYIDIVDVAVSGPAKINDYINLDYHLIQLQRPK